MDFVDCLASPLTTPKAKKRNADAALLVDEIEHWENEIVCDEELFLNSEDAEENIGSVGENAEEMNEHDENNAPLDENMPFPDQDQSQKPLNKITYEGHNYSKKESRRNQTTGVLTTYYRCCHYKKGCKVGLIVRGTEIIHSGDSHICGEFKWNKRQKSVVERIIDASTEMHDYCCELALKHPGTSAKEIAQNTLTEFTNRYKGLKVEPYYFSLNLSKIL